MSDNLVFNCGYYLVDLSRVLDVVNKRKTRKILLHAPDGLKHLYVCIQGVLEKHGVFEIYFSSNPGYGACDIPFEEASVIGVDLIVHIGHERYPFEILSNQDLVVYVPVYIVLDPSLELVEKLVSILRENNYKRLTISSTLIDKFVRGKIREHLLNNGFTIYEIDKPVLGCMYRHIVVFDKNVDAHIIITGGLFHPLGLGLVSRRPVVAVDPFMGKIWFAHVEAEKILRKRLFNVVKAKNSLSTGLIVGTRPGQYRVSLVEGLKKHAMSKGYRVYVISTSYLTIERLASIDSALNLDFYVVTSCPRLPIDDLGEFHKPVLTPGEFLMIIRNVDEYIYPW
ncbi:MAG: diphthamide biosynthesis enzyme Dph2 [Desulfurococcaceae archaeon]